MGCPLAAAIIAAACAGATIPSPPPPEDEDEDAGPAAPETPPPRSQILKNISSPKEHGLKTISEGSEDHDEPEEADESEEPEKNEETEENRANQRTDDDATCDASCVGGTQDGDNLGTPVGPGRGLLPTYAPDDLVALDPPYVIAEGSPPNLLRREAAEAFVALSDAAYAATGVRINIRSGYRPFALQCAILRREIRRQGCTEASRSSARAGFSEHQLGTAADLAIGWRRLTGTAAIDAYLEAHAHRFGWVLSYPPGQEAITGYKHEPWHFRYLGPAAATALVESPGPRPSVWEFLLKNE